LARVSTDGRAGVACENVDLEGHVALAAEGAVVRSFDPSSWGAEELAYGEPVEAEAGLFPSEYGDRHGLLSSMALLERWSGVTFRPGDIDWASDHLAVGYVDR
jgi:hypothetical protein